MIYTLAYQVLKSRFFFDSFFQIHRQKSRVINNSKVAIFHDEITELQSNENVKQMIPSKVATGVYLSIKSFI